MAGIYLHIPFCKSKCPYCNFFSIASMKSKEDFLGALMAEIAIQKGYLGRQKISTIYFGGGTPSLLSGNEINEILDKIRGVFSLDDSPEVTLEANPDDINIQMLQNWLKAGITRLSIGVQSFADEDLKYLGRIHNGAEAERCILSALDQGFSDLSVDFIYGLPTLSDKNFALNLEKTVALGIPHISAYALTVEPGTAMEVLIRKQRVQGPDEDMAASQFCLLMKYLASENYEHYEISNFCKPGRYSRHNSSYWKGSHYLGLGPSAHSFNGVSRQWNVSGISRYASCVLSGKPHFESEILTETQKYNEYVMVSLRTMWGTRAGHIEEEFGEKRALYFRDRVSTFVTGKFVLEKNGVFTLSDQGKLLADKISSDLFADND